MKKCDPWDQKKRVPKNGVKKWVCESHSEVLCVYKKVIADFGEDGLRSVRVCVVLARVINVCGNFLLLCERAVTQGEQMRVTGLSEVGAAESGIRC